MIQFKLADKVIDFFGFTTSHLSDPAQSDATLGHWLASVVSIDNKDALMFMNEKTLLSFVLLDVRQDLGDTMPQAFVNGLNHLFVEEKFAERSRETLFFGINSMEISKADDERLLGLLKERGNAYTQLVSQAGGLENCNILTVIKKLNRLSEDFLGGVSPLEATKQILRSFSGAPQ